MKNPVRFKDIPIGSFFMIQIAGHLVKALRETETQIKVRKVNNPGFVTLIVHPVNNQDDCFPLSHDDWQDPPVPVSVKELPPFKALDFIKSEEDLDAYVHEMIPAYSDDASRYVVWRNAMVSGDGEFHKKVAAALPAEVGRTRRPTADEWDAAIDAVRKAK